MIQANDESLNLFDVEFAQIVNERKNVSDSIGYPIKLKGLRGFYKAAQIGLSTSYKLSFVIELLDAKLANSYTNSGKDISRGVRAISI